jgi:hypothetical protein
MDKEVRTQFVAAFDALLQGAKTARARTADVPTAIDLEELTVAVREMRRLFVAQTKAVASPKFASIRLYLTKRQTKAWQDDPRAFLPRVAPKARALAATAGQWVDLVTDDGDYICSYAPKGPDVEVVA